MAQELEQLGKESSLRTASPSGRAPALAFDQQPKESAKAFAAFSLYLGMGPERSLAAVGRALGKSVGLMERWSARFDWGARVAAHEAHLALVEQQATEALARGKSAEWVKRQQEVREREWEMHERCIAAAQRAFEAFMAREKVYANLADIARMLEVASKLGRLASGLATDKTETAMEVSGKVDVEWELALKRVYGQAQPAAGAPGVQELASAGVVEAEVVVDQKDQKDSRDRKDGMD